MNENIKIININYDDIDKELDKLYEMDEMYQECEIHVNGAEKDIILSNSNVFRVMDKDLMFAEGVYCVFDENENEFIPDFSLTLIYENVTDEDFKYDNYIYFEQDDPKLSIHNFLNIKKDFING